MKVFQMIDLLMTYPAGADVFVSRMLNEEITLDEPVEILHPCEDVDSNCILWIPDGPKEESTK